MPYPPRDDANVMVEADVYEKSLVRATMYRDSIYGVHVWTLRYLV